jgi:hypothetical protein
VDLPVGAADELADLFLALDDDGKGRRLHAADRREEEAAVARVEGSHGPGAVDADEPVGFGSRSRGIGESVHLLVAAQRVEPVADRLGRHRLQPQPAYRLVQRLVAAGVLHDELEYELAFAPRVTGIDQVADVRPLGLADYRGQPGLRAIDGLQIEVGRNHRQVREAPFAALHIEFFRRLDLHQVTDGARDDEALTLEVVLVLLELAGDRRERLYDVLCHGGLLRDHQGFPQCVSDPKARPPALLARRSRVADRSAPALRRHKLLSS